MSAGRRGGTVVCKCQKGRAASWIPLGAGLEKGERMVGWEGVSFVPTLSPSEAQPPVIIPGTQSGQGHVPVLWVREDESRLPSLRWDHGHQGVNGLVFQTHRH